MQINYFGEGKFEIKCKQGKITTGKTIKINDFLIEGPGEYEIAGIEVEVIDGITLLHAENINLAYLDKRKKPIDDAEAEKIDEVDILFVPVGGGEVYDAKEAMAAVNQIEPNIVIPMHCQDIAKFSKIEGLSPETMDSLKISKLNINEEERRVVILNAQSK